MRVIALLSWYDERPDWLAECVASAALLCDHVVAVDGSYELFPGARAKPVSDVEQATAILEAADRAGIGCTMHVQRRPWAGNEVAKRDFMFRLASTLVGPADWFLRIDADELIRQVPADIHDRLAATDHDAAEITMYDLDRTMHSEWQMRALFRALPGIGVQQAHYVVTAPGGPRGTRVLCGNQIHHQEDAEPLHGLRIEHRTHERPEIRQSRKLRYYQALPEIERVSEEFSR